MEVHPPHAPMHSWRDFWIHLGTITIGLLIAISLEQSVEKLHHLHQRHQLEEELRGEGERNIGIAKADQRIFADVRAWQLSLRRNVDAMRVSGGKAGLAYIPDPIPGQPPTIPSNSVWMTAKESQLAVLLPSAEAAMYARLQVQYVFLQENLERLLSTRIEVKAFEDNFDDAAPASVPDLSRMTTDELRTYSMLLTKEVAQLDEVASRLKNFALLDQAALHGAKSEAEMVDRAVQQLRGEHF